MKRKIELVLKCFKIHQHPNSQFLPNVLNITTMQNVFNHAKYIQPCKYWPNIARTIIHTNWNIPARYPVWEWDPSSIATSSIQYSWKVMGTNAPLRGVEIHAHQQTDIYCLNGKLHSTTAQRLPPNKWHIQQVTHTVTCCENSNVTQIYLST